MPRIAIKDKVCGLPGRGRQILVAGVIGDPEKPPFLTRRIANRISLQQAQHGVWSSLQVPRNLLCHLALDNGQIKGQS